MTYLPPTDFTNPYEKEIRELEKQYARGFAEGKLFDELKELKTKIKILKSELSVLRNSNRNKTSSEV